MKNTFLTSSLQSYKLKVITNIKKHLNNYKF